MYSTPLINCFEENSRFTAEDRGPIGGVNMVGGSKDDGVEIVKSKQGKNFTKAEMLCEKDMWR